jgi:hypothetical protein
MKISTNKPPNWSRLTKEFGVHWDSGVIVTYGDTAHTKRVAVMTPDLIAHELVHVIQQKELGPIKWWEKYINDRDFRLSQELEAYTRQAKWIKNTASMPESEKRMRVEHIWKSMATMYKDMVTYKEAKALIPYDTTSNLNSHS